MNIPDHLFYTKTHEWAEKEDGHARVGITDYAQHEITEVVYVELPEVGREVRQGEAVAIVESVKAIFDIYTPLSGKIVAVHEELSEHPEWINEDPYSRGYFFILEVKDEKEWDTLLTAEAYRREIS